VLYLFFLPPNLFFNHVLQLNQEHINRILEQPTKSNSKDIARPSGSYPANREFYLFFSFSSIPSFLRRYNSFSRAYITFLCLFIYDSFLGDNDGYTRRFNDKMNSGKSLSLWGAASLRTSLGDISNDDLDVTQRTSHTSISGCNHVIGKHIIFLEDDVEFVPDSFSPQTRPDKRSVFISCIFSVIYIFVFFLDFSIVFFVIFSNCFRRFSTYTYSKSVQETLSFNFQL
jgi:hypothetical protein